MFQNEKHRSQCMLCKELGCWTMVRACSEWGMGNGGQVSPQAALVQQRLCCHSAVRQRHACAPAPAVARPPGECARGVGGRAAPGGCRSRCDCGAAALLGKEGGIEAAALVVEGLPEGEGRVERHARALPWQRRQRKTDRRLCLALLLNHYS